MSAKLTTDDLIDADAESRQGTNLSDIAKVARRRGPERQLSTEGTIEHDRDIRTPSRSCRTWHQKSPVRVSNGNRPAHV